MTIAQIKELLGLIRRLGRTEPSDPDERDAQIGHLERAVADEREHAAGLRKTIDELHFKAETLERSYSKQLQDARQRIESLGHELAEHKASLAALEGTGPDTTRLLNEVRAELEKVTAERDRLRQARSAGTGNHAEGGQRGSDDARSGGDEMSIDEILEDALWAREQERINKERGVAEPPEAAARDRLPEDMIAPDLVFTGKGGDDESR